MPNSLTTKYILRLTIQCYYLRPNPFSQACLREAAMLHEAFRVVKLAAGEKDKAYQANGMA